MLHVDPALYSTLWFGIRWLCIGLHWLLLAIHAVVPDWGLAIIVLALVIRILLYPLSKRAMASQLKFIAAQQLIQPELDEIRRTYKGGEQSEEILQLYKRHGVSPFAGLKPLGIVLIQLPILIALFHVLGAVAELKDARFLWIQSLAQPDKLFAFGVDVPLLGPWFNLLPVLMSVFTLLSFKLAPAPAADKKGGGQTVFLVAMTLVFFYLFYAFPSGMVLYWTFANIFHIVQYRFMMSRKARG